MCLCVSVCVYVARVHVWCLSSCVAWFSFLTFDPPKEELLLFPHALIEIAFDYHLFNSTGPSCYSQEQMTGKCTDSATRIFPNAAE